MRLAFALLALSQCLPAAASSRAELAMAHGSFLVNGYLVWGNASVAMGSRVEARAVPVRLRLGKSQELILEAPGAIRLEPDAVTVESGAAHLTGAGSYSLRGASSNASNRPGADARVELRPTSQRP